MAVGTVLRKQKVLYSILDIEGETFCFQENIKLVRNRETQQIIKIGHELQGVLCKVRQDDMFRST